MKYENYFQKELEWIQTRLDSILPAQHPCPPAIHDAMRYSVLNGGKRFRPILTMAACTAAGGSWEQAWIPASAIELIHCYSLVHDDLPALDNDDTRRGQPTAHKRFGEAMAILAGDGLLTLAFQLLARFEPAETGLRLLHEISTAAGTYGMIGGQVADISIGKPDLNTPMLDYISSHKTGKLIMVSALSGAIAAQADPETQEHLQKYGEFLGLAFQLVDDLIDQDGYMKVLGYADAVAKTRDVIAKAKQEIRPLGHSADQLHYLADFLLKRIPRGNHVQVDS